LVVEAVRDFVADDGADRAKFTASSAARLKNGGCKIPAGNVISFCVEL
jgi:hypothetical protein